MKKLYFIIALLCVLASCKKDSKPSPGKEEGKTYDVKFNVGFDQSSGGSGVAPKGKLSTRSIVNISNVATTLVYYAYDSENRLVTRKSQDSTVTSFGTISDNLTPGTYTIVVYAIKGKATEADENHIVALGRDIFYDKLTLTVTNAPVTQNINLERVTGNLEIKILDEIEAGTKRIQIDMKNDFGFSLTTGMPDPTLLYPRTTSRAIPAALIGTANYTYSTFITNTTHPIRVTIAAYSNNSSSPVKSVTIDDVVIDPNTRTILSGNLFSGFQKDFTINYDIPFDSDTTTIDF